MTRGKRVKAERAKYADQNGPSRRPMVREQIPGDGISGPTPEFMTLLQQVAYARLDQEKAFPGLHLPTSTSFVYPAGMDTWRSVFDQMVGQLLATTLPTDQIGGLIETAALMLRWAEDIAAEHRAARTARA